MKKDLRGKLMGVRFSQNFSQNFFLPFWEFLPQKFFLPTDVSWGELYFLFFFYRRLYGEFIFPFWGFFSQKFFSPTDVVWGIVPPFSRKKTMLWEGGYGEGGGGLTTFYGSIGGRGVYVVTLLLLYHTGGWRLTSLLLYDSLNIAFTI
jgi:hypothetical protein